MSSPHSVECTSENMEKAEAHHLEDEDSGVFNSSRTTASSLSDHDFMDQSDFRAGAFDYFDNQNSACFSSCSVEDCSCDRCKETANRKKQKHSDTVFDGNDTAIEMKTFKTNQTEHETDVVYKDTYSPTEEENDILLEGVHAADFDNSYEDLQSVVVHKTDGWGQYNDGHQSFTKSCDRMCTEFTDNDYKIGPKSSTTPLKASDDSNECNHEMFYHTSTSHKTTPSSTNIFRNRVDATVRFPFNGSISSESVKIDKTIKKREQRVPAFKDSSNTEEMVRPTAKLSSSSSVKSEHTGVYNVSTKPSLVQKPWIGTENIDGIVTNKKKKQYTDVADKTDYDENGNPVGSSSSYRSDPLAGSNHLINLELDKCPMKGLAGGKNLLFNSHSVGTDTMHTKKKRRKRRDEAIIKPETLPGFIGDKPLDVLLSFIDGNSPSKKSASNHYQEQKNSLPLTHENTVTILGSQTTNNIATVSKQENKRKKKKVKSCEENGSVSGIKSGSCDSENDLVRETFRENSISSDLINELTNLAKKSKSSSSEQENSILKHIEHIHPSNSYIFTDFDNKMPKEEQFTVVTKKKKKHIGNSKEFHALAENKKDASFYRPGLRSYTPPPVTAVSGSGETSQDNLSPSSFPVLTSSKEPRRNSTGSLSDIGCNYKSDTLPVRSSPTDESTGKSDIARSELSTVKSKPMAISYASIAARCKSCSDDCSVQEQDIIMAAGPVDQVNVNSPNNVQKQSLSCPTSDQPGDDKSQTNHSTPATTVISSASSSSTNLSQSEQLDSKVNTSNNDANLHVEQNDMNNLVNSDTVEVVQVVSPTYLTVCETPKNSTPSDHSANITKDITQSPSSCQSKNLLSVSVTDSVDGNSQVSKNDEVHSGRKSGSACPSLNRNILQSTDSTKLAMSGHTRSTDGVFSRDANKKQLQSCSQSKQEMVVKPTHTPKNTSNKLKNQMSKCVIFLDRKSDEECKNLDISFGYEPDLASDAMLGSTLDPVTGADAVKKVKNDTASSLQSSQDQVCGTLEKSVENVKKAVCDKSLTRMDIPFNSGITDLVFMGPEQPGLSKQKHECKQLSPNLSSPNVLPSVIDDKNADKDISSTKSDLFLSTSAVSKEQQTEEQLKSVRKDITVDAKTTDVVSLFKKSDTNIQRNTKNLAIEAGNFNHEAGVAFLYNDWLRIQAFATRYGDSCVSQHLGVSN